MSQEVQHLARRLIHGDRFALSRAITITESQRPADQQITDQILHACEDHVSEAFRMAVTGTPGVGKSTFIEALGLSLIEQGHQVAILAVDPTSARTHGSILGDKTRMEKLSQRKEAFIRPTADGTAAGGIPPRLMEVSMLCAAAGYKYIIIETVGVGQSSYEVRHLVDLMVLLLQPAAGDALQGIKRGILEEADILLVNKADGDLLPKARETAASYAAFLRTLPHGWTQVLHMVSALEGSGLDAFVQSVEDFRSDIDLTSIAVRRHMSWLHKKALDLFDGLSSHHIEALVSAVQHESPDTPLANWIKIVPGIKALASKLDK